MGPRCGLISSPEALNARCCPDVCRPAVPPARCRSRPRRIGPAARRACPEPEFGYRWRRLVVFAGSGCASCRRLVRKRGSGRNVLFAPAHPIPSARRNATSMPPRARPPTSNASRNCTRWTFTPGGRARPTSAWHPPSATHATTTTGSWSAPTPFIKIGPAARTIRVRQGQAAPRRRSEPTGWVVAARPRASRRQFLERAALGFLAERP